MGYRKWGSYWVYTRRSKAAQGAATVADEVDCHFLWYRSGRPIVVHCIAVYINASEGEGRVVRFNAHSKLLSPRVNLKIVPVLGKTYARVVVPHNRSIGQGAEVVPITHLVSLAKA